jgi:hypothetical protein
MSEAAVFVLVFSGLFVLRIVAATIVFGVLLPKGDRCPNCDAITLRVRSPFSDRFLPWFRKRWCLACGWHGMLRRGSLSPETAGASDPLVDPPHKQPQRGVHRWS